MNAKNGFALHVNYNNFSEIQFPSDGLNNQIPVFILCKYSFKNNPSIDIGKLVHNNLSYNEILFSMGEIKINFSFNEIMSLKGHKIDFYIVDGKRLSTILLKEEFKNKKSNIYFTQKNGQNVLYFEKEIKLIKFESHHNSNNANNNNINQMNFSNVNKQPNEQFMNFNINNENNKEINNNSINYNGNSNDPYNNIQFNQQNIESNNLFYIPNNEGIPHNNKIPLIIRSLILLYGMEKAIKNAIGVYDLKPYYLVNKTFIETFKEKFQFNLLNNISSLKMYSKFSDFQQNIKSLEALNDVKNISKIIQGDLSQLSHIQLYPTLTSYGEYKFPTNFTIIHEEILNLLKELFNVEYDVNDYRFQYIITFGHSTLYLQWFSNINRIYAYPNNNNTFEILCAFELFDDIFKNIFDRYLQTTSLNQYLTQKNIKLNIKNKKQPLTSTGNRHLGDIIIIDQMSKSANENMPYDSIINNNNNNYDYNMNNIINNNINMNNNTIINNDIEFNIENNINNHIDNNNNFDINYNNSKNNKSLDAIYKDLIKSLNGLKHNKLDLPKIEDIKSLTEFNILTNLTVFIIEKEKLNYCLTNGKLNPESLIISHAEVLSGDKLNEHTSYSFINEEICIYFKIKDIDTLPKANLFIVNKNQIFIFYPAQNILLKVINYQKNTFNIKKPTSPLSHPSSPVHTKGLQNIGATCYMNATLQCLCHIDELKKYFFKNESIMESKPLAKQFYIVMSELWKNSSETYYAPHCFKNQISLMNPLFKGIQANDSKDLILFIFETIHNELNNPSENPVQINFTNIPKELVAFRQNYYSQNYSIISKLFYYEQSSVMKCKSCGFETLNFNIMNCLIFPLEKVRLFLAKQKGNSLFQVTLDDCFKQNEDAEVLSGANQIYCNKCHQNSDGLSYNKLYNSPEILTIILNRGKGLQFDVNFKFPMNISIKNYVMDKSCYSNYELFGVLTHLGGNGMDGHFIAYCKSPVDHNWYFYNDAIVKKCDENVENDMHSKGIPYILFYQKRKVRNEMENNINIENYSNSAISANYPTNSTNQGKKCIYIKYGFKEVYYEYDNDYKNLGEVFNELCQKYGWNPSEIDYLSLSNDENQMIPLDNGKSLLENKIQDGDKILVVKK